MQVHRFIWYLLLVCLLSSSINGISLSSTFKGYEELGSCFTGTGIIKLAVITPSSSFT